MGFPEEPLWRFRQLFNPFVPPAPPAGGAQAPPWCHLAAAAPRAEGAARPRAPLPPSQRRPLTSACAPSNLPKDRKRDLWRQDSPSTQPPTLFPRYFGEKKKHLLFWAEAFAPVN